MKKSIGPHPFIQPNPVLVIGSYDQSGNPNMMTVAWGGICCSVPPVCGHITSQKVNLQGLFASYIKKTAIEIVKITSSSSKKCYDDIANVARNHS